MLGEGMKMIAPAVLPLSVAASAFAETGAKTEPAGDAKFDGLLYPDITSLHITEKEKTWN
jgi:hypothetical protein